ncbi:YdgA family protein [Pseudomonas huaxiensis]|uniref:YdgA family protein n=1 Tax=Pseudomonas huaxiensis TaxID=2213017 RepID=UPI000DA6841E|nr:YdgA family protein [Pseudomonas huaxiensis]
MKKTLVVIGGLAVLVAGTWTSIAWNTGQQLPAQLNAALADVNRQLGVAMGTQMQGKVELLSLESHKFTSLARYRVTLSDPDGESVELDFVDHIEHGPFPWSRLKQLQLAPVMAASTYALEKTDKTEKWFAAAGDQLPLGGSMSLSYGGAVRTNLKLAPLEVKGEEGVMFSFSGLTLQIDTDAHGDELRFGAAMEHLTLTQGDGSTLDFGLKDLTFAADMSKSRYGFYVGSYAADLGEVSVVYDGQPPLKFGLDLRDTYRIENDGLALKGAYQVSDISYAGKPLGSARMGWSVQRLNPEAIGKLVSWYEQHMPELEAIALEQSDGAQLLNDPLLKDILQGVLAGQPRVALEELSFKTASGESRVDLAVDLAGVALADLPPEQALAQSIKSVQANLKISKPMIGDIAALRATLDGLDADSIRQASAAGEMVGMMALQTQMATVQGDNIQMHLGYADGLVDFNGQKMTVEQFDTFVRGRAALLTGAAQ